MKSLNVVKSISLIICFIVLFPISTFAEDLIVEKVTRITHPAYRAANIYYGLREKGVWNADNTRIMLYELPQTHPTYGTTGRGIVWATIADATSWTTQAEYEAAFKPVPRYQDRSNVNAFYWSPFANEPNIIYVTTIDGWVIKIDVDTGTSSNRC